MAGGCQYKRGFWTVEEDRVLMDYVKMHGEGKWNRLARETGLKRGGKSCRLRWMNYLSPNIRRGDFSEEEDDLIIRLHNLLGNRWSLIAGRVPGRTDNQVKNHWNTRLSKKLGIKKGRKKVSASSRFSIKIEGNLNAPSSFNSTPPSTCNEKAREGGSEIAVGLATGSKEPTMDGNRQSPFWFSYDDQNQNDYNLMEFLDDFICHGL